MKSRPVLVFLLSCLLVTFLTHEARAERSPSVQLGGGGISYGNDVSALAFSSRGILAVAVPKEPVIELWGTASTWASPRTVGRRMLAGGKPALHLDFSPDGSLIAVASAAGVEIFAADSEARVGLFPGPRGERVRAVTFAPDGDSIYFVDSDGDAKRGVLDGLTITKLGSLGKKGNAISVSLDGKRVAFAGGGPAVMIHDVGTGGTKSLSVDSGMEEVSSLAFLDNDKLAVGSRDGELVIFDLKRNAPVYEGRGASFLARAPDNVRLAMSDYEKSFGIWSPLNPLEHARTGGRVGPMAWHPAGKLLAFGDDKGGIRIFDVAKGEVLEAGVGHRDAINAICVGGDDRWVATLGRDQQLIIWDLATAAPTRVIRTEASSLFEHACVGAGVAHLSEGSTENGRREMILDFVDAETGKVIRQLKLPPALTGKRFALSSARVALAGESAIHIVELATSKALWSLNYEGAADPMLAFSPDGTTLAVGKKAGEIDLHDAATGKKLVTLAPNGPEYTSPTDLVWAPSGDSLVSAVREDPLQRRDAKTGRARWSISEGLQDVQREGVAWSSDGKLIAFGGSDAIVHVVNADTGAEVLALTGHKGRVVSVAFTSDRRTLVSAGRDGVALVWDISDIK